MLRMVESGSNVIHGQTHWSKVIPFFTELYIASNNITWCGRMSSWYIAFCCSTVYPSWGKFGFLSSFSQYFIITILKRQKRLESRGFNTEYSFHCNPKCALLSRQPAFLSEWVSVLEGGALHVDVHKLMWRTARCDKGILSLFMPPRRHFNLEMLDILISLFSTAASTADLTSYIMFLFFFFFPFLPRRGRLSKPKNGARWRRAPQPPRLRQTSADSSSRNEMGGFYSGGSPL